MTITVYNEAGDVVTDPQEQARRLQAEFGGNWVVIYDAACKPTGVAVRDGFDPTDALSAMPPDVRAAIVEGSIRAPKIVVDDISEAPPALFQIVRVKR